MSSQSLKLQVLLSAVDKVTGPFKRMLDGSSGLSKSIKGVKDQLADLNTQQKRLDGLTKATDALNENRLAIERTRSRVRELRDEIVASENPHQNLKNAYSQAVREAKKLERQQAALVRGHEEARINVERLGVPIDRLADRQRTLTREIETANEQLRVQGERLARIKTHEKQWQSAMELRAKLQNFGVRAMAGGAAVGAATLVPVRAYAEAEDAATQLQVAMMKDGGKVSDNFERINALAMKLGNRLPGTSAELQTMMTMLIRQGMSEEAILGGLGESAALLAVQLKKPFAEAAEFAAKLQDATRTTEGDMLGLMDVIQRSFYLGVDSNNMLAGFAKMSPALATIRRQGLDAARVLAPLLVMADQSGMDGSAAGNAIRKIVSKALLRDSRGDSPGEFGLDFTDGKGEFGGFEKLFAQLAKLKSMSSEERGGIVKSIFGDDAEVTQVVSLMIDKGQAGYDEVLAKMQAQAALQDRVNKQLGTLSNLWEAATGTATNALVAFGETIAPEVKALTEWIGSIAEATQAWARENPALSGGLMKLGAALAGILTVAGALALAFSTLVAPFALARGAFVLMGGAGLKILGIIGLVTLAVGAVAWAVYELYDHWGPITSWFRQQWDGLLSFFSSLGARFEQIGLDLMLGLSRGITNSWASVKSAVTDTADRVTVWFKDKLGIQSPSRVFAELGDFTMQGLEQGLVRGQAGPMNAIGDFSRRFATAAALSMTGAGIATAAPLMHSAPKAMSSAAPMSYVIHIDARGAADAEGIRRVVREELETHRRQLAARKRSTLGDID